MTKPDYKTPDFIEVDQYALDEEWAQQASLYHRAVDALADARSRLALAKKELEEVRAELDREVRLHPSHFDLEKTTEAVVANTVILQKAYKEAYSAVVAAHYEVDKAQADVGALDHKKAALQSLVQLRLADYFAEPRLPRGVDREKHERLAADAAFGGKKKRRGE